MLRVFLLDGFALHGNHCIYRLSGGFMRNIALLLISILLLFSQSLQAVVPAFAGKLPVGSFDAKLSASTIVPDEIQTTGEDLITDFTLHKGQISGVIRDQYGLAKSELHLTLIKDGVIVSRTTSDAGGTYLFNGIAKGDYTLVLYHIYRCIWRRIRHQENSLSIANFCVMRYDIYQDGTAKTANWEIAPGRIFRERPIPVAGPYAAPQPPPYEPEEYIPSMPSSFISPLEYEITPLPFNGNTAGYSNLRRHLNHGIIPPQQSIRLEELYNYFDYYYPKASGEEPYSITTEVAPAPWNQKRDLLMIGVKTRDSLPKASRAANLVFLVDVSGSMATEHKLPMVKEALWQFVGQLRPGDRLAIVAYNADQAWLLGAANGDDLQSAYQAIELLEPGATATQHHDISLAFDIAREQFIFKGQNRIIHCSDGDFSFGMTSIELENLVVEQADYGISFHPLGFGMGQYRDPNLRNLAQNGQGSYAYIDNLQEAQRTLHNLVYQGSDLLLEDLQMSLRFPDGIVKAYRYLGFTNDSSTSDMDTQLSFPGIKLESGRSYTFFFELVPGASKEQIPGIPEVNIFKPEASSIRIRAIYRQPGSMIRKSSSRIFTCKSKALENSSERFRFAAAVLGFGLKLQGDPDSSAITWQMLENMATNSLGEDHSGERAEFIRLLGKVKELQEQ